jgi:hypothetical protein
MNGSPALKGILKILTSYGGGCKSRTRKNFYKSTACFHRNNGKNDYRKQDVEIALGPKAVFGNGDFGSMNRQMPEGKVLTAIPPPRGSPRPLREPRTPRVAELLRKAIKWKGLLETGRIPSQAEIARQEGLTRARVSQILSLLSLAPKIQKYILLMPATANMPVVTERSLRPITCIEDHRQQMEAFLVFAE